MNTSVLEARLWLWIEPEPNSGCWLWSGPTFGTVGRYGRIRVAGKTVAVHRLSYELDGGEIPEGYEIDHLCRNTVCVNPRHLEPVTPKVNRLRSLSLPAQNARRTHCRREHEFTPENTYITSTGRRHCRACDRARWHRRCLAGDPSTVGRAR